MSNKKYIPFLNDSIIIPSDSDEKLSSDDRLLLQKVNPKVLAVNRQRIFTGWSLSRRSVDQFEPLDFDFKRISLAYDNDSYVRSAMSKYRELFWKEGWEIVGENDEAVSYLYSRIDIIEYATNRSFLDILMDFADQLFLFSNAFAAKARAPITGKVNGRFIDGITDGADPVVGYFPIPTETIRVKVDQYRRPLKYEQNIDDIELIGRQRKESPKWDKDDVVHFYLDRKPGKIFGVPFILPVLDDVLALRIMEEDIQNLVHRELHPIYQYVVGTESQPAEDGEIENAVQALEGMRAEGGIVTPFRHAINIIGAQGKALEAESYLNHFKERVAIGLGLAPHHLGMTVNSANRSLTERLDVALYDRIKNLQKQFAEMVRVFIFNELLIEGGFDPSINPTEATISDRCYFLFKEIDVDTQVKKQTHALNKYNQGAITWKELRMELGMSLDAPQEETLPFLSAKLDTATSDNKTSADAAPKSTASKNKAIDNVIRPKNQFGQKTSPGIKRSDSSKLDVESQSVLDLYDNVKELFPQSNFPLNIEDNFISESSDNDR